MIRGFDANGGRTSAESLPGQGVVVASTNGGFVWVDVSGLDAAEMMELGKELGLHPLAVEDATASRLQPKVQWFEQHLFIVMWEVRSAISSDESVIIETFIFARPGLLVTVQRGSAEQQPVDLSSVLENAPTGLAGGVMSGVHAIVSSIIDGYIVATSLNESELEELEDQVFDEAVQDEPKRIYELRKRIGKVTRAVSTLAIAFSNNKDRLDELTAGNRDLEPFVQDLIDDLTGVNQLCADQEVALDGVISTHENAIASAQGVDSRKISAIAAMLAIPAVISGLYGMNFTNLPGTNWPYGWVVIALVIVLIEVWAYILFKQRAWL
ncbi:CorA family divalent cation transporter [Arthrobacter sp. NPDC056886]|uniref:CorA family divalent cation transporter n=1 Tax=Arthrobacter sp. NPDC056886 TaxID=3345960 RepID=UPI00366F89FC